MSINADKLLHLMKIKSETTATLARKSGINDRTIRRILKGESETNNQHTTTYLAKALGVTPEDLAQPPSLADLRQEQEKNAYFYRMAFQVTGSERLNFDLVQHRYGVSALDMLKAAPALYALVAEMSLAKRRADLETARAALPPVPEHLKAAATVATYRLADVLNAEEASIARADLFGRYLDKALSEDLDFDVAPPKRDPFHDFFWTAAEDANENAFPDLMGLNELPDGLFPADLDALTGNDHAAKLALKRGRVRIQAIPTPFIAEDRTTDRAAWLASHLTEEDQASLRHLNDIPFDVLFPEDTKEANHGV